MRERVTAAVAACAQRLAAPVPALTWIGFQADGHVFAPGTAAEALLAEVHETVLGAPLETMSMTATSDTRFYDLYYGIPALCYGGHGRGLHAPGEAADLASLQHTTEIIARFVAAWCGVRPVRT